MARRNFKRPRHPRTVGRKAIVVCEGQKTERGYFEAIRQSIRLPTLRLRVIHPDATDPLTLVRSAIEEKQFQIRERAWFSGDRVWAVFDGDEHRMNNPDRWRNAIKLARSHEVHLAISNPNFEFWYLLHYQDQSAHIDRTHTLKLLRKYVPRYDKSMTLWPSPLQPLIEDASTRAENLISRIQRESLEEFANPSTGVHELVRSLLTL